MSMMCWPVIAYWIVWGYPPNSTEYTEFGRDTKLMRACELSKLARDAGWTRVSAGAVQR